MRNRFAAFLVVAAAMAFPGVVQAQYFGQNKVQYRHMDFQVIETEHFEVHYYQGLRDAAVDASQMAERAYARLSRILNHQYRERQPIILYASEAEFQQTNLGDISEGTGGVTDPFRHRIMMPFTGAYKDFEHVLMHEMVHQFQFDIFARGRIGGGIQRLSMVSPPLWFMEGMAEYLSIGPIDALTVMWLRDAALEGNLPSIEEMTFDPRVFPYRFGHSLLAYIGERWGDEVIGEILNGVATSSIEQGFRRALGMTLETLSDDWQDAVRRTYLPQITDLQMARQFSKPLLTEERSTGSVHVSPAISNDGRQVAYFSEGSSFWFDLYVADAETGKVKQRLTKSAMSSDLESLRFLTSSGSWSPDGRYFAIAAKHGGVDDLVILDVRRNKEFKRIKVDVNGMTTPSWSPDGKRIVFTGYEHGWSDMFIVNVDGTNLERLTNDKFADLHPAWSPDGKTIAFATDRDWPTDVKNLKYGPPKIALYNIETHAIEVLPQMIGSSVNPQWTPDGKSIAFVSDRNGTHNLYLFDMGDRQVYQLTNVFTGIAGFSAISPSISWARGADRLVYQIYEKGPFRYNVYAIDNPRGLKRAPYEPPVGGVPVASLLRNAGPIRSSNARPSLASAQQSATDSLNRSTLFASATGVDTSTAGAGTSIYRDPSGFRASDDPGATASGTAEPVSVKALLDSANLALPDTNQFGFKKYSAKLQTDFIARPSIGYTRDNFGNGVYGGAGVSFSDILGNHRLSIGGQVNGRIEEAVVQTLYANLGRRLQWAGGYQQFPVFFFTGSEFGVDSSNGRPTFTTSLERLIYHQAILSTSYPFTKFRRIELGVRATYVSRANQDFIQYYNPNSRLIYGQRVDTRGIGSASYVQPSLGMTFDNSVSLWVGPTMGRRSHFEYAPAIGTTTFHEVVADYRRYDVPFQPFTIATRAMFFGRFGSDSSFGYRYFLGYPDLIRGYTSGSFRRRECLSDRPEEILFCEDLEQLIGTRIGVLSAELRFPLIRSLELNILPIGFPPIEGAVFFDMGMAWNRGNTIIWPWNGSRGATASKTVYRVPLKSYGFSIRANLGGFVVIRVEYARPLDRPDKRGYWTINLGPTF